MISKQSAGYFREKAVLGISALNGDEIDKAIVKTTSHVLKAPKEKYMQSLLAVTFGQYKKSTKEGLPVNVYIIREIERRTHSHNWIVVEKALVVLHRFLAEGSESMVRVICGNKDMFSVYRLKHLSKTAEGGSQQYFMEQYMRYLEERCRMQEAISFSNRVETVEFDNFVESLNMDELAPIYDALLRAMETLVNIEYRELIVNNFCTLEAYEMILRDSKMLFKPLTTRLAYVLKAFDAFSSTEKRTWFQFVKRYDTALRSLIALMNSMRNSTRVFTESIPALRPLPQDLVDKLEDAAMGQEEKPEVCTLESLGISSSEKETASPSSKKKEEVRKPANEALPAPKPQVPTFNMEDLFISTPPSAQQNAQPDFFTASPQGMLPQQQQQQQTFQTAQDPFGAWGTGAPSGNDMWSTGAPSQVPASQQPQQQQWQGSAPIQHQQPQQPQFVGQQFSPQQHTQPPTQTKKSDPFKDLFTESQNMWQ